VRLLLRWIIGAVSLYLTVLAAHTIGVSGLALRGGTDGAVAAFLVILALTLVNAILRPILKLLTLPLNCLTFGLFGFVINAFLFWLVGQLGLGFVVKGWIAPLFGSLVLSAVSGILNAFVVETGDSRKR